MIERYFSETSLSPLSCKKFSFLHEVACIWHEECLLHIRREGFKDMKKWPNQLTTKSATIKQHLWLECKMHVFDYFLWRVQCTVNWRFVSQLFYSCQWVVKPDQKIFFQNTLIALWVLGDASFDLFFRLVTNWFFCTWL